MIVVSGASAQNAAQPATLDPNPTYLPACPISNPAFCQHSNIWNGDEMETLKTMSSKYHSDELSHKYCRLNLISNLSLEGFYFIVKAHRYKFEIKIVTESGLYKSCHMTLQSFFSFDLLASCLAIASRTLSSLVARGNIGLPLRGNESPRFGGCSPRARL